MSTDATHESKRRRRCNSLESKEADQDRLTRLLAWLHGAGIQLSDAIAVVDRKLQFSVEATHPLDAKDVVATIPLEAILNVSSVPEVATKLERFELHEDIDLGLSTCILWERVKGSASKWAGYFDSLRTESYDTPIGWTEEKLTSVLGDTLLHHQVSANQLRLKQAWDLAVKPLLEECMKECSLTTLELNLMSLEGFTTAVQMYNSRAFLPREDLGEALVPLADLFNHKVAYVYGQVFDNTLVDAAHRPDILVGYRSSEEDLTIVAVQEIVEKRELFNTYGEFGNRMLFMEYGFTVKNNLFNTLEIPWPTADVSQGEEQRQLELEQLAPNAPFVEALLGLTSIDLSPTGDLPDAVVYRTILVTCNSERFTAITSTPSDIQPQLDPYLATFYDGSSTSSELIKARRWIRTVLEKAKEQLNRQVCHEQLRQDDLNILDAALTKLP